MGSHKISMRRSTVLLCAICGVIAPALSIGVAVFVYRLQTETIHAEFGQQVDRVGAALERELVRNYEVLYTLKALYDSSPTVTRATFGGVARQVLTRRSAVQALEWLPRVLDTERQAHEASAPATPTYRITERRTQGSMVPASVRDEYFPVYYVEPRRGNELAIGFDVASDETRKRTLDESRRTGRMLATAPITLVQEGQQSLAFLVFLPVYDGTPATDQARWDRCRGFVLGVFRVDDIIEVASVFGDGRSSDMHLTLFHAPAGRDQTVLYRSGGTGGAVADMTVDREIADEIGLSWHISASPTTGYVAGRRNATPWLVFAGLFTFTEALAVLLFLLASRQRALIAAHDQVALASRVKNEFLTVMSHELRTPLSSVIGLSDSIADDPAAPSPQDYAQQVKRAAGLLLAAIDDILDLVSLETGELELSEVELSPTELVTSSVDMLRGSARAAELALELDIRGRLPDRILGDGKRIQQVLLRLIQNAIKFTDTGVIVVRVTARDTGDSATTLLLEVIDAGIGIAPEHQSDIFHAFTLVDGSDARLRGGIGVGLALCKRLVDSMGGQIGVDSELDRGSRFWFSLTLDVCPAPASGHAPAAPADPAAADPARARLLIVDDNPIHRKVMARILDRLGYPADLATDGREAVEAARRTAYACILMDCQMPHMDGFQAAAAIRELEGMTRRTPIIAITAHTRQGAQTQALAVGMDEFLIKPVTPQVLAAALSRYLAVQ